MHIKNLFIKALVHAFRSNIVHSEGEKRFLILSTTGLGDTLWGTPAIRALRQSFPASYIGVVTSPIGKAVLQHNRRIDEIFVAKDPLLPSLISLYRKLKVKKITHVLSFHTSQRPLLPLASIIGAQEIIGTCKINKDLDFLLSQPLDGTSIHEIQRRLQIVTQVGANPLDSSMELFLSPENELDANTFLKSHQIPPDAPLIAFHPGSKDLFKRWPVAHFIDLGNRLAHHLGCCIFVTGNNSEKDLVETVTSQIKGAISAIGLPLLTTAALIKRMDLMVTNDTGPMHIAFALKTPTIGLFTPTDPSLCGPYFVDTAQVIFKKPTCSPCLKKKCLEPFCLLQIGVQEVYDSALKLFHLSKNKDRSNDEEHFARA